MLTAVLGPVCTALTVSFVWPQVYTVHRRRTVEGVAPLGTLQGLAGCSLWTMYGLARGIGPLVVSNASVAVALLLIAAAQIRHGALTLGRLAAVVVAIAAVGGGALAVSTTLTGWLALVVGVTAILPQAVHVLGAVDLSGVSLPMYVLILTSTVLWVTYGVLIGDWLVVATNAAIAPCALLVAWKAWTVQRAAVVLAPEVA